MPGVITYRAAGLTDARFLYDLKNDPGVRNSSIQSREGVSWNDHLEWLGRALKDRQIGLWIVLEDELSVGTFRIQKLADHQAEVAIHLVSGKRHNGLGFKVLQDWARDMGITWAAKIVDANDASIRLFKKMGFRPESSHSGNGVPFQVYKLAIGDDAASSVEVQDL